MCPGADRTAGTDLRLYKNPFPAILAHSVLVSMVWNPVDLNLNNEFGFNTIKIGS